MGGARNLKLGEKRARARAQEGKNFLACGSNVGLIRLSCASKTYSGVQGQSSWSGVRRRSLTRKHF